MLKGNTERFCSPLVSREQPISFSNKIMLDTVYITST